MMKSHYYESITFEVEQGLKKPEEYYDRYISSIISKKKTNNRPKKWKKSLFEPKMSLWKFFIMN